MFKIEGRKIGQGEKPFIIAEMSGNHNQSLDRALSIVEAAAKAGASGLKIQTYTPDTMTINIDEREFHISDPNSLWIGTSLYKLYEKAYTPWDWHKPIFNRARELGMVPFSSPFDDTAVDFLESLNVPCYKISSFENTDIHLIKRIASTGKPIFMSTGMATLAELDESIQIAREAGCKNLVLLKCTSTYPAIPSDTNIRTIPYMRELFRCEVGLSDHTMGSAVSVASIALGATVIEKHLTLSRKDGGVDSAFSMEPTDLSNLVSDTQNAWMSLGAVSFGPTINEKKSLQYRRSLYVVADISAGNILTSDNVRAIRPGLGLPTKYLDIVIGKRVNRNISRGTALSWDLIE